MILTSFIFGLITGSFLNVVIYRLDPQTGRFSVSRSDLSGKAGPSDQDSRPGLDGKKAGPWSVLGGRSRCPHCGQTLKWFELIPVLSFIIQKRKCNYCGGSISWQYPMVELGTAVIFSLIAWQYLNGGLHFF